jgi:hypothetical protein
MPVTFVRDPATGVGYSVNIAGNTPTEQETARINEFLAAQSSLSPPILPPAEPAPPPVEERATAFGRGVGLEPLQLAYSRAVTQRVFADQYGTPEQAEAARLAEQEAIAEIQRFQEVNPSVGLFDIENVGDVGSFAGEVLGGEAADLAIQLGATGTGAGIGSLAGPGGTAIGAGIGRGVGVGITTYRMLPQLFAEAITAQERAGNDPSIARAAATTVGNALLEFVTDYFTLIPGGGEAASRIRKAAVTGGNAAITQGGTEALQQVIVRAQAGLPLDNEEAAREIAEAFANGLVFAAPGAAIGFASRDGQLDADQKREADLAEKDAARAIRNSSAPVEFASVPQGVSESTIALSAPPQQTEAEWRKGFRRYERERARDIKPVSLRALPIEEVRAIRAARQAQISAAQGGLDQTPSGASPAERAAARAALRDQSVANRRQLGVPATVQEIQAVIGTEAAEREVQKQKPMSAAETAFAPIENKSFSQQQFDAVLDTVRATGKINFPEVKKVLQKTQRDPVPTAMVNDVLTEASNRGLFERTAKPRKDGGTRFSYQLSPALTAAQTEGSINQKQLTDIQREFAEKQQEITRLQEEARRIEQTGTTLDGKPRKISTPERKKIARLEADTRSIAARMQDLSARMGLDPAVRPIPALELTPAGERQQQRDALKAELADQQQRASDAAAKFDLQIIDLKKRLSDPQANKDGIRAQISDLQTQRELARGAVLRGQTPTPPTTLRYTPRFQRIANNLRGRLDKLGLTDVGVKLEGLLDRQGSVEGVYSPENRVIRLAAALHDSNLSDTQLEARLSEIMDHELIHALSEMGLFTDAERASLIKAAGERKYVAMIDGKPSKRRYTYLQRAQRMYADQDLEVQQEEAIAEMFRNYASGRDKFAGRPQNIFRRIINFFKSFSKAATQEGAQGPADIFAGIERGEIGARERAAVPGATERESRRALSADVQSAQQRLAQDPGSLGLTPDLVSRISPIYRPSALPKGKMPTNREAALWLENFYTGVPITDFTAQLSPEQIREIATLMAAEAELALQNSGNAFDWYSSAMAKAIDIASVKYPMLDNDVAADEAGLGNASNARFVFTYIMAVTSQNMDVASNAKETDTLFGRMLEQIKVGDYTMPKSWGTGDKRKAMGENFAKFGPLVGAMRGDTFPERIAKLDALFRESKMVKEWEADLRSRGIPYSPPGQTAKDAIVYGSSTLGPKIGNGFWQNLNGNYTPLTIDLWMRRTWGRLTGKSIGNPAALPEQRQRFKDAVARSRSRLRGNKEEIARVTGRIEELLVQVNNLKNLDIKDPAVKAQYGSKKNINEQLKLAKNELADAIDARPDLLGIKAPEVWQTAYNKDNTVLLAYAKRSLKPWEAEYKKLSTRLSKEEIADITPTWVRAAKTIVTNLGKPIDQVANGTQRKQIEEAGLQALDILESRGIVLTNADLQAVLWYPEKDLWGSLSADLNVDEDGTPIVEANLLNESYDGAFARILEKQGYDVRGREGRPTVAGSDARLGRPGGAEGSGGIGGGGISEAAQAEARPEAAGLEDNSVITERRDRESRRPMYSVTAVLNAQSGTNNMTAIQKQVSQYTDLSDWFAKGLGIIVRDKTKDRFGRTAAQRRTDKFLQTVQDSFLPVGRMIKEMKDRGLTIMDAIDPYLKQQLSRSVSGARIEERKRGIYKNMQEAIKGLTITDANRESLIKASRSKATKGDGLAAHIFDLSGSNSLAVAEIYLYAKHALERNEYVRKIDKANQAGSGMTDAEANAILNWFSSNLSQQNRSAIAQIEAAAKAIVADTNKVRVDGNLIPAQLVNLTTDGSDKPDKEAPNFQNYVPLRGRFDDDDSVDYGITPQGRGFSVSGKEDQALLGRDSYGGNIIANLLFQNQNSIVRAGTNEVALSLVDLMESDPNITKSFGRILKRLPQQRILNPAGNVQYTVDRGYKDRADIVIAKRNGEDIIVELDDANIAGAFNGKNIWNVGHAEKILRFTGMLNRYLSAISTSFNPEFTITNLPRDLQTAGVQISEFELPGLRKEIILNAFPAMKGIYQAIIKEDYNSEYAKKYMEFVKAGGSSAANPMQTLEDQIAGIDSLMRDLGKGGPAPFMKKNLKRLGALVEGLNTAVENAVRLTTYDALKKRGFSSERAAQAARSVTVDFTKTGDMGSILNSLYLFYNASLQGSFFLLRSAARSKRVREILAGAIVAGFVNDMLNALFLSDEDDAGIKEYDKFDDWFLEHNIVFMLPGGRRFAIPMPYGLNAFYNTGRSISSAIRRNAFDHYGAYDVGDATKSIRNTLLEVVNPLGGAEHFLSWASPTIADPFISLYGTNIGYDDKNIRKEAFPNQRVAVSQLYWSSTSPTAVTVANALNEATGGTPVRSGWLDVSPDTLEFWFDFALGGAGGFAQRTLEAPYNIATAEAGEDVVRQIPFLRKIYGSVSTREDLGTYIEGRDQLLELRADYRNAVDNRDVERVQRLRQNNLEELRLAEAINRIEQTRRKITQRINDITANESIPDDQKRALLEQLDNRKQQVITRGLQLMSGQSQ